MNLKGQETMDKQYAGIGSGHALGGIYSGESANAKATLQPPLSGLYEAVKYLNEAQGIARDTADRLCGTQPEAIGKDDGAKSSSVFGQIDDLATDIRSLAARIFSDMQRIQSRL